MDPKEPKDDRRKSLGKYVKRMSSVFKKNKPQASSSAPAAPAASAPEPTPQPQPQPPSAAAAVDEPDPRPIITQELNRSALQQERARALFAKYGLTLESHEWIATAHPISVQRVEKPIRMRVHRSCHHCGTTYGADKVCVNCEHKRCKKCPRYPKKKTPTEKQKVPAAADDDAAAAAAKPKKKKLLTLKSKTGGELVYQHTKQRVRRTCHKCHNMFLPASATICDHCRHVRCTKCPREPAKLDKWPHGYPGDVDAGSDTELEQELEQAKRMWRKPRTRVRWECEECHRLFIEGSPQCPGCGHARCEKCIRKPLKRTKVERSFDPEVVKAVEAKLKALQVDDDPLSSA
ncbi:unnamed protein product [Periconia digitata]|uniref:Uncharacterized protein n=1 Tax=Periconia digitata TaxID=1303443 RepID=A0A9W4UVU0_9PLEO|nr:unnamed protein product [Periconia digitata]